MARCWSWLRRHAAAVWARITRALTRPGLDTVAIAATTYLFVGAVFSAAMAVVALAAGLVSLAVLYALVAGYETWLAVHVGHGLARAMAADLATPAVAVAEVREVEPIAVVVVP